MADENLSRIAEYLKNAGDIVILPHDHVDGDALGASLALALALKTLNKDVDVVIGEDVPATLNFLPGLELLKKKPQKTYDVAINIDNGDISRLGYRESYYRSAKTTLSIDHHSTNKVDAHCSYVDITSAATGEIVYDLITKLLNVKLDRDMALCLYTAIVTDTGCFRYTNTTPRTLEISAELLRQNIDFSFVIKKVFDMVSLTKLSLMKETMNSLRLLENGRIAVSYLTYDFISQLSAKNDDFEGLVNIGRNLEGVEVSIFLREEEKNHYRGSLRSNEYVDVSKIAEKFNGGGHKRAAGLNIDGNLEDVINSIVNATIPEL
ncbi:MAG: bifunctional oligoribonuclease/PAP phosphatase NrnA [Clostridiaceae bacterium]|nr:bifunctional oligoribonuclease/PAP phosphatase NrnA [Clostridiaceae bacterium]